jgi:hypothetical protein
MIQVPEESQSLSVLEDQKQQTGSPAGFRRKAFRKGNNMTEQVLRSLFDFQRLIRNPKLDAMIENTRSETAIFLSESELEYVNAAGIPEMMGLSGEDSDQKDSPWNLH